MIMNYDYDSYRQGQTWPSKPKNSLVERVSQMIVLNPLVCSTMQFLRKFGVVCGSRGAKGPNFLASFLFPALTR